MRQSFRARRWWRSLGAIVAVLTLLVSGRTAAQTPPQKANSIPSDDFGYEDAGPYGGGPGLDMATPTLERLAEGITLHSFYAQLQSCTPGRADQTQYLGLYHPTASMYADPAWFPDLLPAARLSMWSLTLPQVAAVLAATIDAFHTFEPAGQRLSELRMLPVVLVLMLSTATLGPVLTRQYAPRKPVEAGDRLKEDNVA